MLDSVEEIKRRLDIVEIIGEHVVLKPAGINMKGLCPFHNERTPSFMVHKEKQTWHCFGCAEGGDIFSFVQKLEGMDFPTTLKMLAERAGIELVKTDPRLRTERMRVLALLEDAAGFYHRYLLTNSDAESARAYVTKRQLNPEVVRAWQIGFAPDRWDGVCEYLRTAKYTEDEIVKAGLAIHREGGRGGIYDRFRGRVMFPLKNTNGHVVGFSGRLLKTDDPNAGGKYINTPQTLVYDKGNYMFGLDRARHAIRTADRVVVVEGQLDVISSHRVGVENVVGVSGTALTEHHLDLLKRFTTNIAFCFDSDTAGERAGDRSVAMALKAGFAVYRISLDGCSDPDVCAVTNPDHWKKVVSEAKEILTYTFDQLSKKFDLHSVEGGRKAITAFLDILKFVPDQMTRSLWMSRCASLVGINEQLLRDTFNITNPTTAHKTQVVTTAKEIMDPLARYTLGFLRRFPELLTHEYIVRLPAHAFPEGVPRNAFECLMGKQQLDVSEEIGNNESTLSLFFDELELLIDRDFADRSHEEQLQEARDIFRTLLQRTLQANLRAVERALHEGEAANDERRVGELTLEFTTLTNQIHTLSKE